MKSPSQKNSSRILSVERTFEELKEKIISCRLCPRLVSYREGVPPRASFVRQKYWRRPVPGFGSPSAWLVIIGLAPAAHGGNRTGRVFTGDESGRFLVEALHSAGLANQPYSVSRKDGLQFYGCYVTAAVKCAPPNNRPTPEEFRNCSVYLQNEMYLLRRAKAVLTLGHEAFKAYAKFVASKGDPKVRLKFAHGKRYQIRGSATLYASYHPTPRNTYTGKLTKKMLVSLLERIKEENLTKLRQT
jgi:uracil-DNA glycosylase family 4